MKKDNKFLPVPNSPCKNCQERKLHCHESCENYLTYSKANEERRLRVFEKMKINDILYKGQQRRMKSIPKYIVSGAERKQRKNQGRGN
jgi:hypothetical protein